MAIHDRSSLARLGYGVFSGLEKNIGIDDRYYDDTLRKRNAMDEIQ